MMFTNVLYYECQPKICFISVSNNIPPVDQLLTFYVKLGIDNQRKLWKSYLNIWIIH